MFYGLLLIFELIVVFDEIVGWYIYLFGDFMMYFCDYFVYVLVVYVQLYEQVLVGFGVGDYFWVDEVFYIGDVGQWYYCVGWCLD